MSQYAVGLECAVLGTGDSLECVGPTPSRGPSPQLPAKAHSTSRKALSGRLGGRGLVQSGRPAPGYTQVFSNCTISRFLRNQQASTHHIPGLLRSALHT